MPIVDFVDPVASPATPGQRYERASLSLTRQPDPLAVAPAVDDFRVRGPLGEATRNLPGFLADTLYSASTTSVVGALGLDAIPYHLSKFGMSDEIDPSFDVRSVLTDSYLAEHPYLVDDALAGVLDDFPNAERFSHYVSRKRQDYDIRQRLGQLSIGSNLLYSLPGQALDLVAGGVIARGVGAAGALESAVRTGSLPARLASSAGLAAAGNLAQEELLRAANPNRNVDESSAAETAIGFGVLFGSAVPAFVAGKNRLGGTISDARVRRMQRQVRDAIASDKDGADLDATLRGDVAALNDLLNDPTIRSRQGAPNEVDGNGTRNVETDGGTVGQVSIATDAARTSGQGDGIAPDFLGTGTAAERRPKAGEYSIASIQARIVEIAEQDFGLPSRGDVVVNDALRAADTFENSSGGIQFTTSFAGPLPTEVREWLQGRGHLRRFVQTNVRGGLGEDSLSELGDRWYDTLEDLGSSDIRRAVEHLGNVSADVDPEAAFMLFLNRSLDDIERATVTSEGGKSRQVMQRKIGIVDNPAVLPEGSTLTIHGKAFEVVYDGEYPYLVGDDLRVPLEAFDSIPIDRDSLRSPVVSDETLDALDGDGAPSAAVGAASPNDPAFLPRDVVGRIVGEVDAAGASAARTVQVLRTPETERLMKAIRDKYGVDAVNFVDHPMQGHFDWLQALKKLDADLGVALPADLGVAGKVADFIGRGVPVRLLEAPAVSLGRSPSPLVRQAARLFFDFARSTQEAFDRPGSASVNVPAEGLLWNLHAAHNSMTLGVERAMKDGLKDGPITYTFADGTTIRATSYALHRHDLGRAVVDYMREDNFGSFQFSGGADPFTAVQRLEPIDVHPAIKKAAEAVSAYTKRIETAGVDVKLFRERGEDARPWTLPRRWKADTIARSHDDFVRRLVREFQANRLRDYNTLAPIDPITRPVLADLVNAPARADSILTTADRATLRQLLADNEQANAARPGSEVELVERDIPATAADLNDRDLYARYLAEVELEHVRRAEEVFGKVSDTTSPASSLEGRTLEVNELNFKPYLEADLEQLVGGYHHSTAGRIAARQAVKRSADQWAPLVKEATGKDLATEAYNPALILETIGREFQRFVDATKDDPKLQASLQRAAHTTLDPNTGLLAAKVRELEGLPAFGANPAAEAGWSLWLKRNSLRFPYLANLGKMTISAFVDLAAGVMYKHLTPAHVGTVLESINLFKRLDRPSLEALYVATSDMANGTRAFQYGDLPGRLEAERFGSGVTGRVLSASDAALDGATKAFNSLTLLNRWNSNLKRGMSSIVMQTIIGDARKMAAAGDLVRGGMSEADALARVFGDKIADARRMGRLGMNFDRSARLVDAIDRHGLDWQGNPIKPGHDGYVSPEFEKWAASDRDLFDQFTYAVNSEVQNVIIEPKLLSRPIVNQWWLGRAFNQFQSFSHAWGNQWLAAAAQRPGYEVAASFGLMVGLGALVDALHNQLSGRRSFDETAAKWTDNPAGMLYGAVDRSGATGWLSRYLGLLEATPIGIARNLGNDSLSTVGGRRASNREWTTEKFAPVVGLANKAGSALVEGFNGEGDQARRHLFSVLPFRNLWAVEAFNRFAESQGLGTPIGPAPRR